MKVYFYVALGALSLLTSCQAQSITTTTNSDGSVTVFKGNTPSNTITISPSGNLGIGKENATDKLEVNGQIHARSVKVDLKEWADVVFEEDYNLPRLREIEAYINNHGHLPNIPSEKEVLQNGIELGEMNTLLLQKIEELTLHLITKEKQIDQLQKDVDALKTLVKKS